MAEYIESEVIKQPSRRRTILISIGIMVLVVGMNILVSILGTLFLIFTEGLKTGMDILTDGERLTSIILKYAYTLTGAYMIIAFFIIFGIFKLRKIKVLNEIKMGKIKMPSGLVYLLFIPTAYGLSIVVNNVLDLLSKIMTLPGLEEAAQISNMNSDPLWYKIVIIAIIAPFFEEFVFRGAILNELRKANGIVFAIIFQGFLFGVYHLNITQGAYAMVLGIVFGWFVYQFNSIWPGIIMHVTINGSSVIIAHIYSRQVEEVTGVSGNLVGIIIGIIVIFVSSTVLMKVKKRVLIA